MMSRLLRAWRPRGRRRSWRCVLSRALVRHRRHPGRRQRRSHRRAGARRRPGRGRGPRCPGRRGSSRRPVADRAGHAPVGTPCSRRPSRPASLPAVATQPLAGVIPTPGVSRLVAARRVRRRRGHLGLAQPVRATTASSSSGPTAEAARRGRARGRAAHVRHPGLCLRRHPSCGDPAGGRGRRRHDRGRPVGAAAVRRRPAGGPSIRRIWPGCGCCWTAPTGPRTRWRRWPSAPRGPTSRPSAPNPTGATSTPGAGRPTCASSGRGWLRATSTSAWPSTATATACWRSIAQGTAVDGDQVLAILADWLHRAGSAGAGHRGRHQHEQPRVPPGDAGARASRSR